jgi:hypothetical protein
MPLVVEIGLVLFWFTLTGWQWNEYRKMKAQEKVRDERISRLERGYEELLGLSE